MKHLSWKYIAGLIDGEGCLDFQINKSRYKKVDGSESVSTYITPRIRLALSEPSKFVLDLLQNQCGGNVWFSERQKQNPVWQNAYYWQLENSRCRATLQEVKQFLLIKKEQAEFLIWVIDNLRGKALKQQGIINIEAARQAAIEELKAMKRDPQRLSEKAVERIQKILNTEAIVQIT